MGKKDDLNGIDCGIDVGARRAGPVWVFQKLLIWRDF